MKTTLRIATALLFTSVCAFAQQATVVKQHANGNATARVTTQLVYNPGAQQISGNPQEVQMVACTDKVTYCDRTSTTIGTDMTGGVTGYPALFQVFPDFSGTVTHLYATLKKVSANTTVRIGLFPLSGGQPTTTYNAYYDAAVSATAFTEYGGALTGNMTVTNGFAVGVFMSPSFPNDSCYVGYRTDADVRDLSFTLDATAGVVSNEQYYSFNADYLFRPKISFTAPTIQATASPTTECAGIPISFGSGILSGEPDHYNTGYSVVYNFPTALPTYAWNFGDAGTSTLVAPNHPYATAGTYTVTETTTFGGWTTMCACAPATTTVTITGISPSVSIAASATTVCPNQTVNFSATPVNGGSSPTYVWKKNNIQVGTTNTYAGTGWAYGDIITCEMVSNAACASATPVVSNQITMITQPLAVSSFNYSATGLSVTFTSTATNAVSWAWNFGDAGTSISPTPVHTYAANGTYSVDHSVTNSCGITTVSFLNISVTSSSNSNGGNTGLNEKELDLSVVTFPNPVNNEVNIMYAMNHPTDATIEILNTLGQVVSTQVIPNASTGTAVISTESFSNGVYFVRFTAADQISMTKIVRQ